MSAMLRQSLMYKQLPPLKHRDAERYDPTKMGAAPSIRYATEPPKEREEGEEKGALVKIKISDTITKEYHEFGGGTPEEFYKCIKRHEALVDEYGYKVTYTALAKELSEKKDELKELKDQGRQDSDEAANIETAIEELKSTMKETRLDAFRSMNRLLDEDLERVWDDIVVQVCDTRPHVTLDGVEVDRKRGRNFEALYPCYKAFMACVCPEDAAERQTRYNDTTIKKPKNVLIYAHGHRLNEMNLIQKYLPCLKNKKGAPADLPRMDKPKTELEMCNRLVSTLPLSLSTQYFASKGVNHFPIDYEKLMGDIELIEKSAERQESLFKQLTDKVAAQGSDAKGAAAKSKMKNGDRIPKKPKKDGETRSLVPKKPTAKLCNRCAQWAPAIKNTHNTADCKKFNADGTRKGSAGLRNANVHGHDDDILSAFNTMRKEQKALGKQLKKLAKKSKKRSSKKRSYDSSDESSSDSDDE